MSVDIKAVLRGAGIQPTPQRVAVAECVLSAADHPSADAILDAVRRRYPAVARATIYNTLQVFTKKGLVRRRILKEGTAVYDPQIEPHHHVVDEDTGTIYDVPWSALEVRGIADLSDYEVLEYQVVIRGRRRRPPDSPAQV